LGVHSGAGLSGFWVGRGAFCWGGGGGGGLDLCPF
jgi:hypothetical protein